MSERISSLEKARLKVKELEKKEKEKYDKSREKYRMRIGKIIDTVLDGKNLDTNSFRNYLKKQKDYIEKNCLKK